MALADQLVQILVVLRGIWSFHTGGVVARSLRLLLAFVGIAVVSLGVNAIVALVVAP